MARAAPYAVRDGVGDLLAEGVIAQRDAARAERFFDGEPVLRPPDLSEGA